MTTSTAVTRTVAVPSRRVTLAAAGPLWATVALAQAFTRDGFDLTRHPLSLLSTGSLGWLQIANFVVAGLLMVVGAGTLEGTWAPRLTRIAGVGMIAAGVLVMDPGSGFPAGTPDTVPTTMSWHAIGHMAAGTVTFTALIAACYVLARRFAARGARGAAVTAAVAGTALLAGDLWAMSGGTAGTLTLAVGAITAMLFISLTAHRTV
ncbi:DUF998 domain-containing protein [Actinoplanes sp. NPDC024001]|uniref:DUF998 domain-containing protein n=1 Tax=Actinoplanes sp. NPDC024001 TaxID=3154598 RepID=UPI0033C7F7AE